MKINVPVAVSGTCIAAGERHDFSVKAGKQTAKSDVDVDVFRHLVEARLATDDDAPIEPTDPAAAENQE